MAETTNVENVENLPIIILPYIPFFSWPETCYLPTETCFFFRLFFSTLREAHRMAVTS